LGKVYSREATVEKNGTKVGIIDRSLYYSVKLPKDANHNLITSKVVNGMLYVSIPKNERENFEVRKINISGESAKGYFRPEDASPPPSHARPKVPSIAHILKEIRQDQDLVRTQEVHKSQAYTTPDELLASDELHNPYRKFEVGE
jgi:hypothetical protein